MYRPTVSILIPCYNSIDFITATIESVVMQTYSPKEIIVRDDCSTDGTWELLLGLREKLPIEIYRNEKNLGMCGNWNKLFIDANGELIVKLDADDLLENHFLETAIRIFNEEHTIDAVAFSYKILENNTNKKKTLSVHQSLNEGLQERLFETVFFKNPFALCFTIFKRSAVDALSENEVFFLETEIGDLDFLLRFAKNKLNLYYVHQNGGYYRHHLYNSSKQPLKQAKSWINDIFPAHCSYLKEHLYKDTKRVLLNRITDYIKICIFHRQKVDLDYLKVSLKTFLKF